MSRRFTLKVRYIILTLIAAMVAFNTFAQPVLYTKGIIFHLTPGVKKMVTKSFEISNGQITSKSTEPYVAEFDTAGNCLKEIFPNGRVTNRKYDKQGNMIEESSTSDGLYGYIKYNIDYEKNVVIQQEKKYNNSMDYSLSKYDTASKILTIYKNANWQASYKYQTLASGDTVKTTELHCKDSTCNDVIGVEIKTEIFDANGRSVKINRFRRNQWGDSTISFEEYEYNNIGKKIKMRDKYIYSDGHFRETIEHYDDYGNLIERKKTYNGILDQHIKCQYQYDKRGNHVSYKNLDKDNNLLGYSETSYDYY